MGITSRKPHTASLMLSKRANGKLPNGGTLSTPKFFSFIAVHCFTPNVFLRLEPLGLDLVAEAARLGQAFARVAPCMS